MNDRRIILGAIILITLGTTVVATPTLQQQVAYGIFISNGANGRSSVGGSQPAISDKNVYVVWFTNTSGNWEVMFRASTDGGKTFGDKINLSNSSNSDSTRAQIDSDGNSVVVTWWETSQTSDMPVMRISDDNGKSFGPLLKLASNGTIGSGEAKPIL